MGLRKKLMVVAGLAVFLIILGVSVSANTGGRHAAVVGDDRITEKEMRLYMQMSAIAGKDIETPEEIACAIAKIHLASDEIAAGGEALQINRASIEEEYRQAYEKDREENESFCEQAGITKQDMIDILTETQVNAKIKAQHLLLISPKLIETYRSEHGQREPSPAELLELYDRYVDSKVEALEVRTLDQAAVDSARQEAERLNRLADRGENPSA